jgi:hypothetical protein
MKKLLSLAPVLMLLAAPDPAAASGLHLRVGGFFPRADTGAGNDLFRDANELYTRDLDALDGVGASDWIGVFGGAELTGEVGSYLEVGVHVDGYGRTLDTLYRDFVDADGRDIFQTLKVTVVPLGATLRFVSTRREALAPYAGGGVDLIYYKYEAFGDFVDFADVDLPVYTDAFLSEGWTFGFHAVAGVRVPINYDWSVVGEVRYQWGEHEMGDDFRLNRIDLTGASATIGVHVRF